MSLPRLCRQWDIYRANLGESQDAWILVLSSTQTNEILDATIVACEIVPEQVQKLPPSPLSLPVKPEDTGLEWPAAISVMTLASLPRNCLVSLEGRLEPINLRTAAIRGLNILVGAERWP